MALIKSKGLTVAKFLRRYIKEAGNVQKLYNRNFSFDQDYEYALHTVWNISFNTLKDRQGQNAFYLLGVLAFFSSDSIPAELFLQENSGGKILEFCDEDGDL